MKQGYYVCPFHQNFGKMTEIGYELTANSDKHDVETGPNQTQIDESCDLLDKIVVVIDKNSSNEDCFDSKLIETKIIPLTSKGSNNNVTFAVDIENNSSFVGAGGYSDSSSDDGSEYQNDVIPNPVPPISEADSSRSLLSVKSFDLDFSLIHSHSQDEYSKTDAVVTGEYQAEPLTPSKRSVLTARSKMDLLNSSRKASSSSLYADLTEGTFTISIEIIDDRGLGLLLTNESFNDAVPTGRYVIKGFRNYPPSEPRNSCQSLGLKVGDIIEAVNGQKSVDPAETLLRLRSYEDSIELTIVRPGPKVSQKG